jgi:GTPase SAR1 family protein
VGQNVSKFDASGVHWSLWDLGGGERFRDDVWPTYFAEVDVIVFVVDAANDERLAEAKACLSALMKRADLKYTPLCVLANKQDEKGARKSKVLAKDLGLRKMVDERESTVLDSCFDGPFGEHYGFDEMERWVMDTLNDTSIETVRLRADLRASLCAPEEP